MTTTDVHIVVGFDGSDDATSALSFAAAEALAREGDLRIVYAIDDTMLNSTWGIVFDVDAERRGGEELLAKARAQAIEAGLAPEAVETGTLLGQPAAVLTKLSEDAALVVVGRRSESGERSMFVGSTAAGLAGAAGCPVVMTSQLNATEAETKAIGVGLDPGAHGLVAVEWAMKRAKRLGDRVQVLTVVKKAQSRFLLGSGPSEEQIARAVADVRAQVEAAVGELRAAAPDVDVAVEVRYGSPIDELLAFSEEQDMLILGVHPSFPTYSLGGVVRGLMAHANCTLGLIRHK